MVNDHDLAAFLPLYTGGQTVLLGGGVSRVRLEGGVFRVYHHGTLHPLAVPRAEAERAFLSGRGMMMTASERERWKCKA